MAALFARPRSKIDDVIAFLDNLGIVLDYDHGVLIGAQALQDLDQTAAVARVQADGRLVENVERIDQRRADRGGEIDAFQFAAGKRARLAIEGEIFQTDADEIGQAPANFIKDEARYLIQGAGRLELLKKAAAPQRRSWRSLARCLCLQSDNSARRL